MLVFAVGQPISRNPKSGFALKLGRQFWGTDFVISAVGVSFSQPQHTCWTTFAYRRSRHNVMPYVNPDGCRSLCMALPNVRLCCQMWAPPTPPQDDHDLYIDQSVCFLYEPSVMPESQLPPVYVKKEHKRIRVDPAMSKSITHAMVLVVMTSKASFVYRHFSVFL